QRGRDASRGSDRRPTAACPRAPVGRTRSAEARARVARTAWAARLRARRRRAGEQGPREGLPLPTRQEALLAACLLCCKGGCGRLRPVHAPLEQAAGAWALAPEGVLQQYRLKKPRTGFRNFRA